MANRGSVLTNSTLQSEDYLQSPAGHYRLTMQLEGNLLLQQIAYPHARPWGSGTNGNTGAICTMTSQGELKVTTNPPQPPPTPALYDSGTDGNTGASLVVSDDGHAIIYDTFGNALWDNGVLLGANQPLMFVRDAATMLVQVQSTLGKAQEAIIHELTHRREHKDHDHPGGGFREPEQTSVKRVGLREGEGKDGKEAKEKVG